MVKRFKLYEVCNGFYEKFNALGKLMSQIQKPHKPIPLVLLLEELNFGGTQKQMLEVAKRIDRNFFMPEIWTLRQGDALMHMADEGQIPVTMLCNTKSLDTIAAIPAIWKKIYAVRPRLIHTCTAYPNIWGRIFARLHRSAVVVGSCRAQRNIKQQHERFLWRTAHAHICNASSIYSGLHELGVPHSLLHFIPNGVDTDYFSPNPAGLTTAPELVCVGRMVRAKEQEVLLHAFVQVLKQVPDAKLHFVGDGILLEERKQLALDLGLGTSVIFHGASSAREHLQTARMFVFSSRDEGMPNAILEAMSCGLPIVSTNANGIVDIVEHKKQGILVDVGDVDALAQGILSLLANASLTENMGQAARKHVVENFSLENLTRRHEDVYKQLCRDASLL